MTKSSYSSISIIYNPNSTGDAPQMARALKREITQKIPAIKVELVKTQRAGHAEELAYEIASSQKRPLIVSASGDGGYNEVVNGVMRAANDSAVAAVLPAGNANDHSRTLQDKPLIELIVEGKTKPIDLLQVRVQAKHTSTRYAHSYIGLGLTPVVAVELNKTSLNALKELWLAVKVFYKYRPFTIVHKSKKLQLDSLLFANINQMAKVLTLADEPRVDDGKFEVIVFPKGKKRQLLGRLAKAATVGLDVRHREKTYGFETLKPMPMQLDGEVLKLPAHAKVRVEAAHQVLSTLI